MGAPLNLAEMNAQLRIHPMWKGFPIREWQKSLEQLESAVLSGAAGLSASAYKLDGFSVLNFDGAKAAWTAEAPFGVYLSEPKELQNARDAFDGLVLERAQPGVDLKIAQGTLREKPIAILLSGAGRKGWESFSHHVHIDEGTEASLFIGPQKSKASSGLCSHRFGVTLGRHAKLNILFSEPPGLQSLSHSLFEFDLETGAEINMVSLASGVEMGRSEVYVNLNGPGGMASISGIHLLKGQQAYDSRVWIRHVSADSASRQNFKCVVADQGKSLFGGKIEIVKDAQQVDAGQSHKALLVSPQAKAMAFPELEVFADDVKAAHGSSVGQMDPEQVFYLKSRGLTETEALRLLGEAFVKDILMKSHSLKLKELSEQILAGVLPDFVEGLEAKMRVET